MALTASELPKKVVGRYSDGNGLIFRVTEGKARDWFLRVQRNGKRKEYYLGKYPQLSLSQAREDEVPKRLHGFFLQLTSPRLNIEAQRCRTIKSPHRN